jgi:hypothetical protein
MVSKCTNPRCEIEFHYFRGGKLFRFDLHHPTAPCVDVPKAICARKPAHATIFFWLCPACATKYTLAFSLHSGVELRPKAIKTPAFATTESQLSSCA